MLSVGFSVFCVSFLLTLSVAPKLQNALPPLSSSLSFSELPISSSVFMDELRKQNNALHHCKDRGQCLLIIAYTEVLCSHIATLENNTEEFSYIRQRYGTGVYDWIIENRPTIELKFDEYLTKELLVITNGKILSEDNGFTEKEVSSMYRDYVFQSGFEKLNNQAKEAQSPEMKGLYAFQVFLLFSDRRLFQTE